MQRCPALAAKIGEGDITVCGHPWVDGWYVGHHNVEEGMGLQEVRGGTVGRVRGYTRDLLSVAAQGKELLPPRHSKAPTDVGRVYMPASENPAACVVCLCDWACMSRPLAQTQAQL